MVVFRLVRTNFIIQTFLSLIAFIAACFLIEPKIHSESESTGFKDILRIVNYCFRINKLLGKYIVFSAFIGFASLVMAWFAQPVFYAVRLDKSYFGYAWVALNLLVAAGSMLALKINHLFGHKGIFLFLAISLSLGFLAIAVHLSYVVFIPMAIFYLIRGTAHPVLKNYINNQVSSEKRATVLSLRSLVIRILYSSLGPVFGFITDKINIQLALALCGISILIPSVIYAILIILGQYQNKLSV